MLKFPLTFQMGRYEVIRDMKPFPSLAAILSATFLPCAVWANNATTTPVGVVTTVVEPSPNGVSYTLNFVAPPLTQTPQISGLTAGRISALSSNSVTVASANWTAGQLAVPSSPVYFQFTSGNQTGLVLRITANTNNSVTIDTQGIDLTTLGINSGVNGDRFRLVLGDTLLGLLGTTADGIVGGNATSFGAGNTDRVVGVDATGQVRTFYYDTAFNQWRRIGTSASQNDVPISPAGGVILYRLGTGNYTLTSTGEVPNTDLKTIVSGNISFHARYFPTDGTLASLGFHQIPGWRSTNQPLVTVATADKVVARDNGGVVRQFYYDGTDWRRIGSSAPQNNTTIKAGSCVYTIRFENPAPRIVSVGIPYNLN